jgi:hypothetical protein
LAFAERGALFPALCDLDARCAGDVVPVTLGTREARFVREPVAARAALTSGARKGRPSASLRDLGGYIGLTGAAFTRARADVIAALVRSGADAAGLHRCLSDARTAGTPDTGAGMTYVWLALVAHLAGLAAGPELRAAVEPALGALHRIADGGAEGHAAQRRAAVVAHLAARISSRSAFVRVLAGRQWGHERIAAEIVTLAFAGWASLAAVIRSGRCLGVTATAATPEAVTELFRVAAPGWLVVRECVEDVPLPGADAPVPAGALVVLSPWLLHRDPRGWADPTRYDPGRPETRRNPWYLPFSAGHRRCPAEAYSRAFLGAALRQIPPGPPAARTRPTLAEGRSACLATDVAQERQ